METVLFKSRYYAAYQSKKGRCFFVDIQDRRIKMSFCQLLAFRQKILAIDLDAHFDAELNRHGIEILTLCNREHLFVLDTLEVVDLKMFIQGIFTMSELHTLVTV
ncbi:hypothetical protein [Sinomicrobium weinanense]|uniref:Uncharacterized protein n=1 Tax=Sinomicrobium weinanense TaxID=2842200 RepID=A0A926Q3Z5_9FLAO|nr:hypothetical protein [Sinomicrobium weinanense]MBC9797439.1 hypothetical protein [Sinomicrobium weinanense]MBU3125457.1 hypothetical protein [Sinomicrobium weinanense]